MKFLQALNSPAHELITANRINKKEKKAKANLKRIVTMSQDSPRVCVPYEPGTPAQCLLFYIMFSTWFRASSLVDHTE